MTRTVFLFLPCIIWISCVGQTLLSANATPANREISLLFVGDFMGHMDQIKAAYDPTTGTYNYDACFEPVKSLLSDADVTIGNLEVTLGVKPYSGYPRFSSPASYAKAIKNAGVDILVTANNHSCDTGKKGLERTLHILDSLAIGHTGTFYNRLQKDTVPAYFIRKNDMVIALLNYTYGTNGISPVSPNIVNYLDKENIRKDIEAVKKYNPDQIIAFVHWGQQYKDLPNKQQTTMYDFFRANGVPIVIGAHPHVVQPMHQTARKESQPASLVIYSLGNFVSHQRTFPRDGGVVFKLILSKDSNGVITIKKAAYTLTWVYEPVIAQKKQYYVLPVARYENQKAFFNSEKHYTKMIRFARHVRTLLNTHNRNIEEDR